MNHQAFTALLQDLLVIANVGANHQLYTHTQVMYSKEYSRWQGVCRTLMGEVRSSNMARVKSIIETALSELQVLRGQEYEWLGQSQSQSSSAARSQGQQQQHLSYVEQQQRQQVTSRIHLLRDALYNVRKGGLPKLRTTYANDSIVVATLDVIDKFIALALADYKDNRPSE